MYDYWNDGAGGCNCQDTYMQSCGYPINCQQPYGQDYAQHGQGYAQLAHFAQNIGSAHDIMYPEIYYQVYPYVSQICDKLDNPYIIYPSEQLVEKMIDDCYDMCLKEMPELEEYVGEIANKAEEVEVKRSRSGTLLRDLIAIILLSELFKRRRGGSWLWGGGYIDNHMW